jgi:hypothetical protein
MHLALRQLRILPPELHSHSSQEQVAHATQDQVAFQPLVTPTFLLVQPDLAHLVLETTLLGAMPMKSSRVATNEPLGSGVKVHDTFEAKAAYGPGIAPGLVVTSRGGGGRCRGSYHFFSDAGYSRDARGKIGPP